MIEWRPPNQPHVLGTYEERVFDPEAGKFEPQRVFALCSVCGENWQTVCESGRVRQHIQRFAILHNHLDPFQK